MLCTSFMPLKLRFIVKREFTYRTPPCRVCTREYRFFSCICGTSGTDVSYHCLWGSFRNPSPVATVTETLQLSGRVNYSVSVSLSVSLSLCLSPRTASQLYSKIFGGITTKVHWLISVIVCASADTRASSQQLQ